MLTNGGDTEGLFRAGFMQSGSPIPVGDITHGEIIGTLLSSNADRCLCVGQPYYDDLVTRTGCAGASDTLQCLREVPYDTLKNAMNMSPSIFAYQVSYELIKLDMYKLTPRSSSLWFSRGCHVQMASFWKMHLKNWSSREVWQIYPS